MNVKKIEVFRKFTHVKQKEKSKIWPIVIQTFKEFAEESTIHGIKYTVQAKTAKERLFWSVIILFSICSAGELAYIFYKRHESGSMRTTIISDQYPSFKFPLPSLSFCHGSIVSYKQVDIFLRNYNLTMPPGLSISDFLSGIRYLREMIYPYNSFPEEMGKLQKILDASNLSVYELLQKITARCMDEMVMCIYEGQHVPCDDLFVLNFATYGICCSFNSGIDNGSFVSRNIPSFRNLYSFSFGTRYILSILIKPYNESDRMAAISYSGGYKILVQESFTAAGTSSLSFMLASGFETIVNIKAKKSKVSPEVLELAVKQKKCRHSTPENIYRLDNCYNRCRKDLWFQRCQCGHYSNGKVKPVISCNFSHIPCLATVIPITYSLKLHSFCNCLPECESVEYAISLTGEPFRAMQFRPGKLYEKARKIPNATALHFTFANQASILESKEMVLSWINLVSSLGGVFSLFLGFSFISVLEFLYFFVFQLGRNIHKIYKKNSVVQNLK